VRRNAFVYSYEVEWEVKRNADPWRHIEGDGPTFFYTRSWYVASPEEIPKEFILSSYTKPICTDNTSASLIDRIRRILKK
jgi:hypothetical protein